MRRRAKKDEARRRRVASEYGQSGIRQCAKKNRYPTKDAARKVAERNARISGAYLRVYKCPCCGGYHITHRRKRISHIEHDGTSQTLEGSA